MKKAILPIVRWAQRQDKVFISVDVRDIKEEKIDLTATTLTFSCTAEDQDYAFTLNFNKPINEKESSFSKFGVGLRFIIIKQERGWWTRLAAETLKYQHIQVDWSKYIDEDDEEEAGGKGLEDWDQNNFQNFQGGQGEGGDEDDEDEGGDDGNQINDDLEKEEQVGGQQAEEQPEKKEHKEEEAQQ